MAKTPQRSLRHEYELYVENEIEEYKDTLPRSAILKIGDEAVAALTEQDQLALTELVVWEEVDRIIKKRIRIPTYATWRRRRIKLLEEFRRPEHWGLDADGALAREVRPPAESHVLVSGDDGDRTALYLAAHGCEVVAVDGADVIDRVISAAEAAGLTSKVRGLATDLINWRPDVDLSAVVCSSATLEKMSREERDMVIRLLQSATSAGGIHLLDKIADSEGSTILSELSAQYAGWQISVQDLGNANKSFVAKKNIA